MASARMITRSVAIADTAFIRQSDLLQDVSRLQDEITAVRLAQDTEIKEIKDKVKVDLKEDIAKMLRYVMIVHRRIYCIPDTQPPTMLHRGEISAMITNTVAAQVQAEMAEWGSKPRVQKLVDALQNVAESDDALLEGCNIQLENS